MDLNAWKSFQGVIETWIIDPNKKIYSELIIEIFEAVMAMFTCEVVYVLLIINFKLFLSVDF